MNSRKLILVARMSVITALCFSFLGPDAHAGMFDSFQPLERAIGDVVSLGGNARQRDWEACERDRKARETDLTKRISDLDSEFASLNESVRGYQRQIEQTKNEESFLAGQIEVTNSIFVNLEVLESQNAKFNQIIESLRRLMVASDQNVLNLESWGSILEELVLQIDIENRAMATVLLQQIKFASQSRDSLLIESVLRLLQAPSGLNEGILEHAWIDLNSGRRSRQVFLEGKRAELNELIRRTEDDKSRVSRIKSMLSEDLANVRRASC